MRIKPEWLEILEYHRGDYLEYARDAARWLLEERETITIDDVREICPPPPDINPCVMGAVFRTKDFEGTGEYVRTRRGIAHARAVQRFRLAD